MAVSTEATVRDVLVAAIQAIAQTELGFDDPNGNVRDYPLEFHQPEAWSNFLAAKVGGAKTVRCWAVDVRGSDVPYALKKKAIRTYTIRIIGYYALGVDGENYKTMFDHARAVRERINNTLTNNLSGTVSRIAAATEINPVVQQLDSGSIIVGEMIYSAERTAPDY